MYINGIKVWKESFKVEKDAAKKLESADKVMELYQMRYDNFAGEEQKGGLSPDEARRSIPRWLDQFEHIQIKGLMTMAPHVRAEECRQVFAQLRELRDELRNGLAPHLQQSGALTELSMGMSNDAEIAAEEGATWVRVGSRLFVKPQ